MELSPVEESYFSLIDSEQYEQAADLVGVDYGKMPKQYERLFFRIAIYLCFEGMVISLDDNKLFPVKITLKKIKGLTLRVGPGNVVLFRYEGDEGTISEGNIKLTKYTRNAVYIKQFLRSFKND